MKLKTPLTLISNYMEKYINENVNKNNIDLMIIKENIDKMSKDVVNFFDMEKLISGKNFYHNSQIICLSKAVEEKLVLFRNIKISKSIKIKSDLEKNLYMKIDPFAFDRMINNLMDNALKFSKNNGMIEIVLKSTDKKIKLSIKDNGIGIDENQIKNIFKPYYQIQSEKRNIQGMGLGLSIVKSIVDLIDGEIKVESKLDQGSCFSLIFNKYIPSVEDKINQTKMSMPSKIIDLNLNQDVFIKGRQIILVVEDNIELINFLHDNISKKYNCFLSVNGIDALEKLKSIPKPNIIISDIMMDQMDGYAFFNEIKKNISNIIIFLLFFLRQRPAK